MKDNLDIILFLAALTVLFVGWLMARIEYQRKLVALRKEIATEWHAGFDSGWKSALKDPISVKEAYEYHFKRRP